MRLAMPSQASVGRPVAGSSAAGVVPAMACQTAASLARAPARPSSNRPAASATALMAPALAPLMPSKDEAVAFQERVEHAPGEGAMGAAALESQVQRRPSAIAGSERQERSRERHLPIAVSHAALIGRAYEYRCRPRDCSDAAHTTRLVAVDSCLRWNDKRCAGPESRRGRAPTVCSLCGIRLLPCPAAPMMLQRTRAPWPARRSFQALILHCTTNGQRPDGGPNAKSGRAGGPGGEPPARPSQQRLVVGLT